jgi:murein DD-endopeptidase MepM/ murein hydrolase activator NlpD
MIDSLSAVQARMASLDATLRSIDPSWRGMTEPGVDPTGPSAGAATAPFGEILASTAATAAGSDATASGGPDATAGLTTIGGSFSASALTSIRPTGATVGAADRVVSPVPGSRISQDFGPTSFKGEPPATVDGVRYAHYHDGVDYAAPLGTPVRAIAAGTVVGAGRVADGAVIVRIRHGDGSESLYGHLDADLPVRVGDRVEVGDRIGMIGMTGHTTGPHLHLELNVHGRTVDPQRWIDAGRLPGANVVADSASATASSGLATAPASASLAADDLARFDTLAADIPYSAEIRAAALKAGIDPLLLTSVVRAESGFRANAVSRVGAQGLAQLMPATSRSMGVKDPFDPATNVAAGARYLANNLRIYGRTDLALAAYQAGKGAVANAGGIPDSPTTHHYIDRILGYWSHYIKEAAA